jgi:hypothetical protein
MAVGGCTEKTYVQIVIVMTCIAAEPGKYQLELKVCGL